MIGDGGGFLQHGIGIDHLAGYEIMADAEVLERTLGLCSPQLVGGNFNQAEDIGFLSSWRPSFTPVDVLVSASASLKKGRVYRVAGSWGHPLWPDRTYNRAPSRVRSQAAFLKWRGVLRRALR